MWLGFSIFVIILSYFTKFYINDIIRSFQFTSINEKEKQIDLNFNIQSLTNIQSWKFYFIFLFFHFFMIF